MALPWSIWITQDQDSTHPLAWLPFTKVARSAGHTGLAPIPSKPNPRYPRSGYGWPRLDVVGGIPRSKSKRKRRVTKLLQRLMLLSLRDSPYLYANWRVPRPAGELLLSCRIFTCFLEVSSARQVSEFSTSSASIREDIRARAGRGCAALRQ